MAKPSPLDDPHNAAFAWARFRRLMRLMLGITLATVIVAVAVIYKQVGDVSPHVFIATALGITFSMLLMSTLMGLVFLSNGTGHDDSVQHDLGKLDPHAPHQAAHQSSRKDRRTMGWKE